MAQGFYELLGVAPEAEPAEIRDAYQRRLAELVRRLRVARQQGADVSILESQERSVREAMEVLSDAARRRSYDAYRQVTGQVELPEDAEQLWVAARGGMVDPLAGAALGAVRALTSLPVGHPLPEPPPGYSSKQTWTVDLTGHDEEPAQEAAVEEEPEVHPHDDIEVAPAAPELSMPPPSLAPAPSRPPQMPEVEQELTVTDPRLSPGLGALPSPQTDLLSGLSSSGDAPSQPAGEPPRRRGFFDKLAAMAGGGGRDDASEPAPPAPPPDLSKVDDPIERLRLQHGDSGAFLRAVREHRSMTLDALARATRISSRYLSALEDDAFDRLPSTTFVRGYLRQVVQVLELKDRGVVDAYMARYTSHRG